MSCVPVCVSRAVCGGRGYRQARRGCGWLGWWSSSVSVLCVSGWVCVGIMFVVMAMFVVVVGLVVVVCVSFSVRVRVW